MKNAFLIFLFFLLLPCNLSGNEIFKQLTIENGLAHSDANSIVQDSSGLIWIGTRAGLQSYDGYELQTFDYYPPEQKIYQSHNRIRSIIHLDNRLYNNFGVAGRVSYRLSDRFTLNAFGSYRQGNGLYHSMAAMPYVATSNYGATISMDISDKFSMEMGAQRYYDPYSHKWITMPILIPQININGSKFGIDVGGLLFQVLHSLLHDYTGGQQYGPADMGKRAPRPGGGTPFLQKASSRHR